VFDEIMRCSDFGQTNSLAFQVYFADADLVKSGFGGEQTESNHLLMYT
jgi:hypothetical protein